MAEGKDDDEATRLAIQQFMLGGSPAAKSPSNQQGDSAGSRKKKKKRKKAKGGSDGSDARPPSTPVTSSPTKTYTPQDHSPRRSSSKNKSATATPLSSQQRREEQQIRNAERQYWRIYRGFFAIVKNEWVDIDDQMEAVISSINNIRNRLPMETNVINAVSDEEEWQAQKEWDGYGLGYSARREHNFALTVEDVHLAMGHDLAQHEKMLKASRSLLSNLSEAQNALGRKLDDLIKHHLESTCLGDDIRVSSTVSVQLLVDEATQVYNQLSQELYRKQYLAQLLFDSVTDDMLHDDDGPIKDVRFDGAENCSSMSSKDTSSICCKEWPRSSKYSFVDDVALDKCLRRCESRQKN